MALTEPVKRKSTNVQIPLEERVYELVMAVAAKRHCSPADLLDAICCQLPHVHAVRPPERERRRARGA